MSLDLGLGATGVFLKSQMRPVPLTRFHMLLSWQARVDVAVAVVSAGVASAAAAAGHRPVSDGSENAVASEAGVDAFSRTLAPCVHFWVFRDAQPSHFACLKLCYTLYLPWLIAPMPFSPMFVGPEGPVGDCAVTEAEN